MNGSERKVCWLVGIITVGIVFLVLILCLSDVAMSRAAFDNGFSQRMDTGYNTWLWQKSK